MKRMAWLGLGVAMAILIASPAMAADKEKAATTEKASSEKASSGLHGEYAMMASVCKLTDEQVATLKTKLKAREDAVAALGKTGEKAAASEAEHQKITDKFMAEILAILTPEQRIAWEAFALSRSLAAHFRKANLTTEQETKIHALCADPAKDLAASKGDMTELRKARAEAATKLGKTIEDTLLTADQKAAMAKKGEAKPSGEKKAEGAAKPAAK
jgi:hypothetical protein